MCRASTPTIEIARWKNDAVGAYSIILDDLGAPWFGDLELIRQSLDATDIRISFATVANSKDCEPEKKAKVFTFVRSHLSQHEILNHSMDHSPPTFSQDKDVIAAQKVLQEAFPEQDVLFFCFPGGQPYNISREERVNLIRGQSYIGARGGLGNSCMNAYNLDDPFLIKTAYYTKDKGGIEVWNNTVDQAIQSGDWGVRTGHNVASPAWGTVEYQTWETHLQYCRNKSDTGKLWVAPVQDVLKYLLEREHFTVSIRPITDNVFKVEFDTTRQISKSGLVPNSQYDEALTLIMNISGKRIVFDADPHHSPMTIQIEDGCIQRISTQ